MRVFHDEHVGSLIARENTKTFEEHQFRSKTIFHKQKTAEKISVGDKVLLKLKPKAFRKEGSTFYPRYAESVYTVIAIDKSAFPPLYKLEHFPGKRRFYAFELRKVKNFVPPLKDQKTIFVKDVVFFHEPILRSGITLANRRHVLYQIKKDNKDETVTPSELKFLKKLWGNDSLQYSDLFSQSEKEKYVI